MYRKEIEKRHTGWNLCGVSGSFSKGKGFGFYPAQIAITLFSCGNKVIVGKSKSAAGFDGLLIHSDPSFP